jgi:hypothetical protein
MGNPHFNRGMSPKMEKNVTFPVTMVPWSCFVVFLTGENPERAIAIGIQPWGNSDVISDLFKIWQ